MTRTSGRHFLQIPGPTNVPERVLRALAAPTIDHRGPEFAELTAEILTGLRAVCRTSGPVLLYPSSGTGMWEAALVNTLSPGERVLMFETGHFAVEWQRLAQRLGLEVELVAGDWRHGVDARRLEERLRADGKHRIKAVAVVHSETSTGIANPLADIRAAIDAAAHPALLLVDAISSLASMDVRVDEWGVDVLIGCSQKGLMLPPGIGLNAVSAKALAACESAALARSYWDWRPVLAANASGFFPYTPPTNLLYGLRAALRMLHEEGLEQVYARHARLAEATRRAVHAWGLELQCAEPDCYSASLTAIRMPAGHDADRLREIILRRFDMSLGTGLGKVKGQVFRIGHLGDLNKLTLAGSLCGVEMGLGIAGIPHRAGGVGAALAYLGATQSASAV